ncbi:RsiV family protein [Psychrobacter ciconiae]|uniref:RsiV family protein n=1 Tax=Psychrobacter ciconiae TaxID=1553449 RepID=UPI00191A7673|nr:RsiV family protein [Psychrobacter ciconiae]
MNAVGLTNNKRSLIAKTLLLAAVGLGVSQSFAASFVTDFEMLDFTLPKDVVKICQDKDNCPVIEVQHLKSNQRWIDTAVNQRVNNLAINHGISDKAPSRATSDQAAKTALNDFSRAQFQDAPTDAPWAYQLSVTPNYIGHVNDIELIRIDSYQFTGGAHGLPYSEHLMFDQKLKRQLKLNDILMTGKKPRFEALAKAAYKKWVSEFYDDIKDYEKSWPFSLTDNVTLTDKGVDIVYQPYAIAPYAAGMPTLSIPYQQLNGILKPQYMVK